VFGSEIKAVLKLARRKLPINQLTASRYLTQHLLESDPEQTFFDGIVKLLPGHYAELDLLAPTLQLKATRYYRVNVTPVTCGFREAADHLRELLVDTVKLQLRSDVPVGVLLSGGVDSSALAGIAQRQLGEAGRGKLGLLSLTSAGSPYDEGPYVTMVERHSGESSTRVDVGGDAARFLELLEQVQWFNEEPVISFSAVAYYLMMARAHELGIKVWLTGQGADEIFCGYKKYLGFYLTSLLRTGKIASLGREIMQFGINGGFANDMQWTEMKRYVAPRHGLAAVGPALEDQQLLPVSLCGRSLVERQLFDIEQTSVAALLHYEDRLSMAHSREVRVPFLDHRVVEFGLSCPDHFRIGTGWSKHVLSRDQRLRAGRGRVAEGQKRVRSTADRMVEDRAQTAGPQDI
jgi:asparagine synthase (glutamine-hydrolysing)